jgi:hypothetical protein
MPISTGGGNEGGVTIRYATRSEEIRSQFHNAFQKSTEEPNTTYGAMMRASAIHSILQEIKRRVVDGDLDDLNLSKDDKERIQEIIDKGIKTTGSLILENNGKTFKNLRREFNCAIEIIDENKN